MRKEEAAMLCRMRMADNIAATGHPLHHLTADGTVVDSDPTLEQWLNALEKTGYKPALPPFDASKVRPSVPVDRMHYGFDPYKK